MTDDITDRLQASVGALEAHGDDYATQTRAQAAMLEAADEIERLRSIVDRIPADRLNECHTVTVHETGWHMAHPIDCVLSECAFDGLAQAEWTEPPHALGVWRWHDFDDEPWEWEEHAAAAAQGDQT